MCSSAFIESPWIVSLYGYGTSVNSYLQLDRPVLSRHFQILKMMCNESDQAFSTRLPAFNDTTLLTAFALSRHSFETEAARIINTFIRLLPVDFQRNMWYNMEILYFNLPPNFLNTDWSLQFGNESNGYVIRSIPHEYGNNSCNCMVSRQCQRPLRVGPPDLFIPGLVLSCSPIDGLRMSTFECFFSSSCIASIITHLNYYTHMDGSSPINFSTASAPHLIIPPLNSDIISRFSKTTLVSEIMDKQFIESWNSTMSYEKYFAVCAPSICRYAYTQRQGILYVITTLLALYGGLTIGLRLVIWELTKLGRSIRNRLFSHPTQVLPFIQG
jgi:hypothetical protein